MAQDTGYVAAGWLKVGSIKNILRELAEQCNLTIEMSGQIALDGRRIDYIVSGRKSDISTFNDLLACLE